MKSGPSPHPNLRLQRYPIAGAIASRVRSLPNFQKILAAPFRGFPLTLMRWPSLSYSSKMSLYIFNFVH
jgi:hypothetical protein